jgi:hypothetical protein
VEGRGERWRDDRKGDGGWMLYKNEKTERRKRSQGESSWPVFVFRFSYLSLSLFVASFLPSLLGPNFRCYLLLLLRRSGVSSSPRPAANTIRRRADSVFVCLLALVIFFFLFVFASLLVCLLVLDGVMSNRARSPPPFPPSFGLVFGTYTTTNRPTL